MALDTRFPAGMTSLCIRIKEYDMNATLKRFIFLPMLVMFCNGPVYAERIKDMPPSRECAASAGGLWSGSRSEHVRDKNRFTGQTLRSMLGRFGLTLPLALIPNQKYRAVSIQAELPRLPTGSDH